MAELVDALVSEANEEIRTDSSSVTPTIKNECLAQSGERFLHTEEVMGSIPLAFTILKE